MDGGLGARRTGFSPRPVSSCAPCPCIRERHSSRDDIVRTARDDAAPFAPSIYLVSTVSPYRAVVPGASAASAKC